MLRLGIISELGKDENLGFARVHFDDVDMVSAWLPLPSTGTKTVKHWQPIEVNSQVACLMDNECEQGYIAAVLWSDDDTPPDWCNENTVGIQFADGAKLYYDAENHKAIFEAPDTALDAKIKEAEIEASDNMKLKCETLEITGDIDVTGDINVTGKIDTTGDITSNGTVEGMQVKATATQTGLSTHVHPTAAPGSPTSPPTPGT